MKIFTISLLILLLISCGNNKKSTVEEIPFPIFVSAIEVFNNAGDFSEEDGSLKIISTSPTHIQVSKPIFKGDDEGVIVEQTKRDIIYVAFQIFAMTDLNEITVTSVPINENKKYEDKYKLTLTVKREIAKEILKKYLNTDDFRNLYKNESTIFIPSDNFDILKFKKLNEVFNDLN